MPIYYAILVILIIFLIISLLFNLLTSPITWIIIAALILWSSIKRYLYQKQLEDFNREFKRKTEEKKKTYQAREDYNRGSDDVIDVDYTEHDD